MSNILTVPVEILLDVFRANDPANTEALQLTCHHFYAIILPNVGTLPLRLVCDLLYGSNRKLRLYRATADNESVRDEGKVVASGDPSPKGLQDLYQKFGSKTAIRKVEVWPANDRWHLPDAPLMQLIEHFPSAKGAVSLRLGCVSVLPSDTSLDHFGRLETIVLNTSVDPSDDEDPSFWSALFATQAFRRVSNLSVETLYCSWGYAEVNAEQMFDFITDFSAMPADKPKVFRCFPCADVSLDALEDRLCKILQIATRQVCAVFASPEYETRYITNMASGRQKKALTEQLLRDAFGA